MKGSRNPFGKNTGDPGGKQKGRSPGRVEKDMADRPPRRGWP